MSNEAASTTSSEEAAAASTRYPAAQQQLFSFIDLMNRCLAEQGDTERRTQLDASDMERLQIAFSSQTAACSVCSCFVSVYQKLDKPQQQQPESTWKLILQSGALILLMPVFEPSQKFAESELLLVYPNTCFPLWRLKLHSSTEYSVTHMFFQTVADASSKAVYGLAFLDADAATTFSGQVSARIQAMTEFESSSLKERRRTFKEKERRGKSLRRLLSRSKSSSSGGFSEISSPCICQRVASATAQDCHRFSEIAFAELLRAGEGNEAAAGSAAGSAGNAGNEDGTANAIMY